MTDIPQDISETAISSVQNAREDFLLAKISDNTNNLRKIAIDLVARAILSERHRCAVIARQWKETPHKSEQYAANTIADRIMAGDAA